MSISSKKLQPQPQRIKMIFLGDSSVGKTCLLNRECEDKFRIQYELTIGCDFKTKFYDLELMKLKVQCWDTAGQERFNSIAKPYYKGAHVVILCFSLAERKSFERLNYWLNQIQTCKIPPSSIFLFGCKSDLQHVIATDEILAFSQQKDLKYFQTSALTGKGVHEAFHKIMINVAQKQIQISAIYQNLNEEHLKQNKLMNNQSNKKKNCC